MIKNDFSIFLERAQYLGMAVGRGDDSLSQASHGYIDIEEFFLQATYSIENSRLAESFLCWLSQFGHLLSPSKIRKLILEDVKYSSDILGCYLQWMVDHGIQKHQWKILYPWVRKSKQNRPWVSGPSPRVPNISFLKYNILAHEYEIQKEKFLLPVKQIFLSSLELKNRALYGSSVNADVASFLSKNRQATAYEVAKKTHHHRARVYSVFQDVKMGLSI